MFDVDAEHFAHGFAYALVFEIVKHRAESGVVRKHKFARHACDEIFFDVKPFVDARKVFGFVVFEPQILPKRVFDGKGSSTRDGKRFEKSCDIRAFDLKTEFKPVLDFFGCALIHIAERAVNGDAVTIDKNKALRLRTEGNAFDLFGFNRGILENTTSGCFHCVPPFVRILLRTSAGENVKFVALGCRRENLYAFVDFDKTSFDAGCAYVVGENVIAHNPPYL